MSDILAKYTRRQEQYEAGLGRAAPVTTSQAPTAQYSADVAAVAQIATDFSPWYSGSPDLSGERMQQWTLGINIGIVSYFIKVQDLPQAFRSGWSDPSFNGSVGLMFYRTQHYVIAIGKIGQHTYLFTMYHTLSNPNPGNPGGGSAGPMPHGVRLAGAPEGVGSIYDWIKPVAIDPHPPGFTRPSRGSE